MMQKGGTEGQLWCIRYGAPVTFSGHGGFFSKTAEVAAKNGFGFNQDCGRTTAVVYTEQVTVLGMGWEARKEVLGLR